MHRLYAAPCLTSSIVTEEEKGEAMKILLIVLAAIYLLGAGGIFWMHTQMPVTFGLALLRSAVWPIWIATGWPNGSPLPMD